MTRMGSYCRAYHVRDLAAFPGWSPDVSALRPADERTGLSDDDVLFLQEDLRVTDGIFLDEHVVFADGGAEWRAFCQGPLDFAVPSHEAAAEAAQSGA